MVPATPLVCGSHGSHVAVATPSCLLWSAETRRRPHGARLAQVGLDAAAGQPLGEALGANRSLEHLTLWKNSLGGKGGKALLTAMRNNT